MSSDLPITFDPAEVQKRAEDGITWRGNSIAPEELEWKKQCMSEVDAGTRQWPTQWQSVNPVLRRVLFMSGIARIWSHDAFGQAYINDPVMAANDTLQTWLTRQANLMANSPWNPRQAPAGSAHPNGATHPSGAYWL